MAIDPLRLAHIGGMLDVLALMATEMAGTEGHEYSVRELVGDSAEAGYQAYIETGPCHNGTPWRTHPMLWWVSSWPGLRWALREWSGGKTPSLPAARAGETLGPIPEATVGNPCAGLLLPCAEDASWSICEALAKLVGADAEVGLFACEHDSGGVWRLHLDRHAMSMDCIIRSPDGNVVMTLGADD